MCLLPCVAFSEEFSRLQDFGDKFRPPLAAKELQLFDIVEKRTLKEILKGRFNTVKLRKRSTLRGLTCDKGTRFTWRHDILGVTVPSGGLKGEDCSFQGFRFYSSAEFNPEMKPVQINFSGHETRRAKYKGIDVTHWSISFGEKKYADLILKQLGVKGKEYFLAAGEPPISVDDDAGFYMLEPFRFRGQSLPAGSYIGVRDGEVESLDVPDKRVVKLDGVPCQGKDIRFMFDHLWQCVLATDYKFQEDTIIPAGTRVDVNIHDGSRKPKGTVDLGVAGPLSKDAIVKGKKFTKGSCVYITAGEPTESAPREGHFECISTKKTRPE